MRIVCSYISLKTKLRCVCVYACVFLCESFITYYAIMKQIYVDIKPELKRDLRFSDKSYEGGALKRCLGEDAD